MEYRDAFCNRKEIEADILAETNNWMIKLGLGIATPGHVMAIPKLHFDCLADVSNELLDEYDRIIHPALQYYITTQFSEPFGVEYGIFGQTVKHAHVHYIPLQGEGYSIQSMVGEAMSEGVPIIECDRKKIRDIRKKAGRYNLLIENGQYFICPVPLNITLEKAEVIERIINYRKFLKTKGGKVPLSWADQTPEETERDNVWREITREKMQGLKRLLA